MACEITRTMLEEYNGEPETRRDKSQYREKLKEFLLGYSTDARKKELWAEKEEMRYRIEVVSDNMGEKMASAVQEFIAQYLSGSIKSVADMLASIQMF